MKIRKAASLFLVLVMLAGTALAALPVAAYAEGTTPEIVLGAGPLAEATAIARNHTVWFGRNNGNYYGDNEFQWRVLSGGADSPLPVSGKGKALLISKDILASIQFNPSSAAVPRNAWARSNAQTWCTNFLANWVEGSAERAAISPTTVTETADYTYNDTVNIYSLTYGPASLSSESFFFLSAKEAATYFSNDDDRIASGVAGWWWLRSPRADDDYYSGYVDADGWVLDDGVDHYDGARPAFNLNLSSVLFSSAAEGGKSLAVEDGASSGAEGAGVYKIPSGSKTDWKLTLHDESRDGFTSTAASLTGAPGGKLSIPYSGAKTGSGEYVSILVCSADGKTALCYGSYKISAASGTASFVLPSAADLPTGSYTVKLFSERRNGAHESDYASGFVSIPLTVEKPKVSLIVKATDQPMNSIQSSPAFAETDGLLNGHTLSAVTITFDPPSGRLIPSGAVITDGAGKNVTDQYSISYAPGVATGDDRIIFTVRFKVNHGKWNDGRSADKVVKLSRRKDEDLLLRLSEEDIPTAGNLPDPGYSEGMWEAEPSDRYAVSDSMTFIYNYIQLPPAQITRVPSKNEFSYDSDEHPLLKSNGTASGGALQYACGTILAPTESWSSAIPTGLEAGIYYVWVKAAGDADHSDSAAQRVKVEVGQAWLDLQAASGTWVYDGLPHTAPGVSVMTGTRLYGEDRLVASATGSVTNVSDTAEKNNPIADEIRIMRGEKDVTQSYSVWYKLPGKLTITARPVTVTAKTQEFWKGGSIQTGTQWATLAGALDGHTLSAVTLVESGGVITPSQAKIQDAAGQDVTANYAISYVSTASAGYSYDVVSGDGQTWHKNSNKLLSFTVKRSLGDEAAFGNFDHAEADGTALTAAQAETEQGSLILRLKPGYLETLSLGSHTIKFIFRDGMAEAAFTVRSVAGSFEDVAVPSDTFTFKKIWQGDSEKSIDFTLYKLGDEVYRHGFDKKVVSKTEWRYSAWFSSPAACYVVEQPVKGYITQYENVGVYAGITDRCCDGGTIINKKLPKTGDETPLLLWAGMALLGAAGVGAALIMGRRRKAHK